MPASVLVQAEAVVATPRRFDTVRLHRSLAASQADWDAMLAVAPATAYQTPAWVAPWCDSLGGALEPLIVVAADDRGPVALLPLGLRRRGGLTTACFLGGQDSNLGLGLFDPALDWDAPLVRRLLGEAARRGGIDLFWLAHQPWVFADRPNPLALLPAVPSPSQQHEARLGGTPEAVLARLLSSKARKHIRQKEAKLAALGSLRHAVAEDPAMAARIAAALLAQRQVRFGATGREGALQRFFERAAGPGPQGRPGVELHALMCGDALVAAFAGTEHAGRFSGMTVSFAPEAEWARFSPGELLIARIVAAKCRKGLAWFDLGIGEARYKESFCPTGVPLFDTVVGMTPRGRVAAWGLAAWLSLKRRIKQTPRLWALVEAGRARWRAALGGFTPRQ
ncbi:GNAT family N-acetyltransferase [Lichenihabitans sp. Uapishka_5]|uniref:GNAT family N-acetyltransferase n=1 Tax=Lichenihabitans sp. Uapishka_5 TaxID=3037302 RepID=UPI0029E8030D|nr:GNAT family N-acetyltransferase [Lichenihabitans sp. Uapishka_5]MDX7951994.1 GNAT family N-acetyltransferase [Lichenihabitans sp. Uapishka_5]